MAGRVDHDPGADLLGRPRSVPDPHADRAVSLEEHVFDERLLPDLGSLAREIGGDNVNVTVLAKPTEDSHFVDARPSFVVALRSADVLIDGGAELELGWLPPLLQNARNAKIDDSKMMLGFIVRRCAADMGHTPSPGEFAEWANGQGHNGRRFCLSAKKFPPQPQKLCLANPAD